MPTLRLLAAGSLRAVWPALVTAFHAQTGYNVTSDFAPAGMLRQRIEQGERCDLFASANRLHPQILVQQGLAQHSAIFAANRLCLTARRDIVTETDNWLSLLLRDDARLATSTPQCDPCGDYTWQLFDRIEQRHAGAGEKLKRKAAKLVGGTDSLPLPAGELAAKWLIEHHYADLFIGYRSYAPRLQQVAALQLFDIPARYNVQAEYAFAQIGDVAQPFAAFLTSPVAQAILQAQGFESVTESSVKICSKNA